MAGKKTMGFQCLYPFVNMAFDVWGRWKPCCRYKMPSSPTENWLRETNIEEVFKGPLFQKLREDIENGIWNDGCLKCKAEEDQGKASMGRQFSLQYPFLKKHHIQSLELPLSSECNMKCRMCSPQFSSKWQEDWERLHGEHVVTPEWLEPRRVLTDQKLLNEIQVYKFVGGEPFMSRLFYDFLDSFSVKEKASEVYLHLSTNGSIFPSENVLSQLTQFKKVIVFVSVDGLGDLAQYIRSGQSWKKVEDNVGRWVKLSKDKSQVSVGVNMSLQAYNFSEFSKVWSWGKKMGIDFFKYHMVNWPEYLSIGALPLEYRRRSLSEQRNMYSGLWQDQSLEISEFLAPYNGLYPQFEEFTKKLDGIRGESWRRVSEVSLQES